MSRGTIALHDGVGLYAPPPPPPPPPPQPSSLAPVNRFEQQPRAPPPPLRPALLQRPLATRTPSSAWLAKPCGPFSLQPSSRSAFESASGPTSANRGSNTSDQGEKDPDKDDQH